MLDVDTQLKWQEMLSFVLAVLFLLLLISPTSALEVHTFRPGQNASITFVHTLTGEHITSELFSLQKERPFYVNGQLDPTALRPDQRHRFNVTTQKEDKYYSVSLLINNINEGDADVYILVISETKNEHFVQSILDAFINVFLPLDTIECNVTSSTVAPTWNEVHCLARLGGDRGHLVCYQQSVKVPVFQPAFDAEDHMTIIFWMDPRYAINCCFTETGGDINPHDCNDFEHPPTHHNRPISTRQPTTPNSHTVFTENSFMSHTTITMATSSVHDENELNSKRPVYAGVPRASASRMSSKNLYIFIPMVISFRL